MSIDLKKLADEAMDEMMSHFPKECGFDGSCYICKDGAYAFARQVTEALLSELDRRLIARHKELVESEALLAGGIHISAEILDTLKREILGDNK